MFTQRETSHIGKPDMCWSGLCQTSGMSLRIYVDAYAGYKASERPLRFSLDDETYDIASIEDRWQEPAAEYFKVRTVDGKLYLLRYDEREDEWTLQSGFDGDTLLARPGIELITVDQKTWKHGKRCHLTARSLGFSLLKS